MQGGGGVSNFTVGSVAIPVLHFQILCLCKVCTCAYVRICKEHALHSGKNSTQFAIQLYWRRSPDRNVYSYDDDAVYMWRLTGQIRDADYPSNRSLAVLVHVCLYEPRNAIKGASNSVKPSVVELPYRYDHTWTSGALDGSHTCM